MKTLKILWLFGLESLEELLFNQLYIITHTYFFLMLLCFKNKVTFEKLLKLRRGQNEFEEGGAKSSFEPPKKTLDMTDEVKSPTPTSFISFVLVWLFSHC